MICWTVIYLRNEPLTFFLLFPMILGPGCDISKKINFKKVKTFLTNNLHSKIWCGNYRLQLLLLSHQNWLLPCKSKILGLSLFKHMDKIMGWIFQPQKNKKFYILINFREISKFSICILLTRDFSYLLLSYVYGTNIVW